MLPNLSPTPEVFPSLENGARNGTSEQHLRSIKSRIRQKRAAGQKLSAVEAHLARRGRQALAGPSVLAVSGQMAAVFLKPAPIILVLALIVATEASSAAWWTSAHSEAVVPDPDDEQETAVEDAFVAAWTDEFVDAAAEVPAPAGAEAEEPVALTVTFTPPPKPQPSPKSQTLLERANLVLKERLSATVSPPAESKYRGLVQFITGVIAVYYPSEHDAGAIARHIIEVSEQENVDPLYIAALIAVESSFKSHARSTVGATGLMQLRPSTARGVLRERTGKNLNPALTDPRTNIKLGILYLKELERQYAGDRMMALSAYNWGPGNVAKARKSGRAFPESVKQYASKILTRTERWRNHFAKATESAQQLELRARSHS